MISIIIRTRNEERWIGRCLEAIRRQEIGPIEIVLVDNQSEDRTVERARAVWPDLKLVEVKEFRPGHALNEGIRASTGDFLVCLSAHCPPIDADWLGALRRNLDDESIAGVYGRQVPASFSSATDKRDLLLTFGLDRRVQVKDTFFHNANSMIPRRIWERFPFDEEVTNIEDRVWGKAVIEAGFKIAYEPDAAVFHYHGIHQDNRRDRAENVVRIMESMELHPAARAGNPLDPESMEVVALIPVRRHGASDSADLSDFLLAQSVESAKKCRYIDRVVIVTDDEALAKRADEFGAEAPFVRPEELSGAQVRTDEVLRYALEHLEADGYFPDIVVALELTHPFRRPGLLDGLVEKLINEGLDTVIAGLAEHRPCWMQEDDDAVPLTRHETPRAERLPVHVGLVSLGCATYPQFIRKGRRIGDRLGIFEIDDPFAAIEVRDNATLALLEAWTTRLTADDPGAEG